MCFSALFSFVKVILLYILPLLACVNYFKLLIKILISLTQEKEKKSKVPFFLEISSLNPIMFLVNWIDHGDFMNFFLF